MRSHTFHYKLYVICIDIVLGGSKEAHKTIVVISIVFYSTVCLFYWLALDSWYLSDDCWDQNELSPLQKVGW